MVNEGSTHDSLFITFEGVDGSGKSTHIGRVCHWFEERGRNVLVTREPGGTKMGQELRDLLQDGPDDIDPHTEALLFAADRAYHVARLIRPALAEGKVVLGDRYIDSSAAYQGAARRLGVDEIVDLSEWATGALWPDLTFLLDLPPEVAQSRKNDELDRLERESSDFHERVRLQYLRLADQNPHRFVVIDAVGTEEEVFSEIQGVLEERFGEKSDHHENRDEESSEDSSLAAYSEDNSDKQEAFFFGEWHEGMLL